MRADEIVELLRRNARNDVGHEPIEDLGGEPAGAAHAFECLVPVKLDHAVAGFGAILGADCDIFGHGDQIVAVAANCTWSAAEVLWTCAESLPKTGSMGETRIFTASLLVIGDEILSGRTQDLNVAQVAVWLNRQGVRLNEVRIVPDDRERIGEAVNALRRSHDYLFTTGGIGPTHDDITIDSIAAAFGVPVVVHPQARAILEDYYRDRGGLTEARLRMARVPEGAELIPNPLSGAPGVRIENVHILAGVPAIAAHMLEALDGTLEGGEPVVSVTIGALATESEIADLLRETEEAHDGVTIGSYPFHKDGRYGANFVVRSVDGERVEACANDLAARLAAAGFEPVRGGI